MNYRELNKIQKNRMKQISVNSYTMKWENPKFMNYLIGDIPKIKKSQKDNDITDELTKLDNIMSTYNSFLPNKANFLDKVERVIAQIQKKNSSWYGVNIYEIKTCLKMHSFCLISGEGGIGKSYFIKCNAKLIFKVFLYIYLKCAIN